MLYLFLAVALAPVVVPAGPARSAPLELVNLVALPMFAASVLVQRRSIAVPFLGPALLMAIGSLIATLYARSAWTSAFTMAQDAYLFAWFVVLVNVLRDRRDLTGFRVTWMWVSDAVAIFGIVQALQLGQTPSSPGAFRATGTFGAPHMLADYMVLSLFVVLGLGEEVGRLARLGSASLLLAALIATRSSPALVSLSAGLVAWAATRAWTLRLPRAGLVALGLFGATALLGGAWLTSGLGWGDGWFEPLRGGTIGRPDRDAERHLRSWELLLQRYPERPMGIGPGNSRWLRGPVEEERRRSSGLARERDDYLTCLVERGPIALLGVLALKLQAFGRAVAWWRRRRSEGERSGGALAAATVGALVANAAHGLALETLHVRHVWLFLALVCALDAMVSRARRSGRRRRGEPVEPFPGRAAMA